MLFPFGVWLQFEWAWIDLARVVVAEWWASCTNATFEARQGKMAFNACNKSLPIASMLVELTDEYLKRQGAGGGES